MKVNLSHAMDLALEKTSEIWLNDAGEQREKNLNKQTGCAVRSLPKLRRIICITLINRLIGQCICGLIEFTVDIPNIPRDVKS